MVNGAINTDRTKIGPWETFTMVKLGGNNVALQTNNGHYITAVDGGNHT
jgi:hypothetical protein